MLEPSMGEATARMNRRIALAMQDATPGRVMTELTHIWLAQKCESDKDAFVLALIGTFGGNLGKGCAK
ncbi:MAG: hypothetical protein ACSHXI_07155 [Hoeflea sp.]|uniref:hypothetical protein n=1 Tax=Hoeflea sp. TaxID=1940281 RepID=UPI003EF6D6C8